MGALARVCVVLASAGALNWVAQWFLQKDLAVILFGAERGVGSDALRILIGMASLYAICAAVGVVGRKGRNA